MIISILIKIISSPLFHQVGIGTEKRGILRKFFIRPPRSFRAINAFAKRYRYAGVVFTNHVALTVPGSLSPLGLPFLPLKVDPPVVIQPTPPPPSVADFRYKTGDLPRHPQLVKKQMVVLVLDPH